MAELKPTDTVTTSIADLWHLVTPPPGATPCRCGTADKPKYPAKLHGQYKQYRVSSTVNKEVRPKRAFARHAEAVKYQQAIIRGEVATNAAGKGTELLRAYAEAFLDRHYTVGTSRDRNRTNLNQHVMPFFAEETRLREITPAKFAAWLTWLTTKNSVLTGRPLDSKSTQHAYDFLCGLLADAVKGDKLASHPGAKSKRPEVDPREQLEVWEEDVVHAMLAAVTPRHHAIPLLAATAGLRQGEAFAISLEDVGNDRLTVRHQVQRVTGQGLQLLLPKAGSVRAIPLHRETRQALLQHVQRYGTTAMECRCGNPTHKDKKWHVLFVTSTGKLIDKSRWNEEVWHPALRAAGIDPIGPEETGLHQLRHFCASMWIDAGTPERKLGAWLGHKDSKSTDCYAHLFERHFEKAQAMMDGLFSKPLLRLVRDDQQDVA